MGDVKGNVPGNMVRFPAPADTSATPAPRSTTEWDPDGLLTMRSAIWSARRGIAPFASSDRCGTVADLMTHALEILATDLDEIGPEKVTDLMECIEAGIKAIQNALDGSGDVSESKGDNPPTGGVSNV